MRIVYVEDNQANVFLVRRIARAGGHDVINYIDGEEALINIVKDDPNLILMDVQLAGEMNGLQVVEKLRSDGYKMPIVAVTAYAMVGDRERCMQAGCNDYIAKPLSIPRLLELIDYYNDLGHQAGSKINGSSVPAAAPAPASAEAPTELPKSEPVAAAPAEKVEVAAENKPVTEPTQPATAPIVPAAPETPAAASAVPTAAPEAAAEATTPEAAKTPSAPNVTHVTEKSEKTEPPAAATSQESRSGETAPSNV